MYSVFDLVGRKFGALDILSIEKNPEKDGYLANCFCNACKKDVTKRAYNIKDYTKSCGCTAPGKYKNIVGRKFGDLEVLKETTEDSNGKKKKYYTICKCHNCGNENFRVLKHSLLADNTTHCGCRRKEMALNISGNKSANFLGFGQIPMSMWYRVVAKAKERGHSVDISIEDASNKFEQQNGKCALTGLPLIIAPLRVANASLDRKDSKVGYCKDNIQWVLKPINVMKNVYTVEDFIQLCNAVAKENPR
jgi:hypothetical protein